LAACSLNDSGKDGEKPVEKYGFDHKGALHCDALTTEAAKTKTELYTTTELS
jgi:hypothetical protein